MSKNPKITSKEIALIKSAQAGDESAFNTLYKRYKPFVENILYKYIGDKDEAKDIANIVFLKVYRKLSLFTSYDSFGGWLRTIANRTALDYLRTSYNKLTVANEEHVRLTSDSSAIDQETDLVNRSSCQEILKEVENLSDTARRVFKLFYLCDMSTEQIAKRLKIPQGTVKSHLSRSRRRIKNKLLTKT